MAIPLGIISLFGPGILFRRRQRHRSHDPAKKDAQAPPKKSSERNQDAVVYEMSNRAAPQEMEYGDRWPKELHSTPFHEAVGI